LLSGSGTGAQSFEAIREAFNTFERDIRGLEDLPLQLRQLSPVSSQFRSSSIDLPIVNSQRPLKVPIDVVIQFEGSGRWPDDITAIQRTKIAFLLKVGSLLQDSDRIITSRLGLENEKFPLQNCAFLDVFYVSGAVFRLRIQNEREQTLLERQIKDKATDNLTRENCTVAMSAYKRAYIQSPLHTQSIATHCTRFPLLSPSIRLMKSWFNHHMLLGHISEEFLELLVARTFLQPYPWRAPSSAMAGFSRTLLFLSRWDWRLDPLIVDFTGIMTSKEVASINTRLEAWRKIDPGMNRTVLIAASNHDMTGTSFTEQGPSKMVASRMTALARSGCVLLNEKGLDLDPRSLFAASTSDYDFVIHLVPKFAGNPKKQASAAQQFKNLAVQLEADVPSVGFEPMKLYLAELERLYTGSLVFFSTQVPSPVIAGVWNPHIVGSRSFKVNLAYAVKQDTESDEAEKIKLDKEVILSEMARIGGDMVSRIVVHR
jgi:U3 small nucleolar RNA-associated protein 22